MTGTLARGEISQTAEDETSEAKGPSSRRELKGYFILAFLLTWSAWIPAGLAARGTFELPFPEFLLFVAGGLGPLCAAVAMTARSGGRKAIRALLAGLDPRKVSAWWFAAAFLLVPLNLVPVLRVVAAGGQLPDGATLLQALLTFPLQLLIVLLVGGGLDEEGGWRGFALPRMLKTMTPLASHALLGVLWALWHLPLWLDPMSSQSQYPFYLYVAKTLALSVLIGWMYAASGGSLAVAVFAHAVSNSADSVRYQLIGSASASTESQFALLLSLAGAAALVGVLTRGKLGADRIPPGSRDE